MLTVHSNPSIQNSILQDYKSSYGLSSKHEIIAEWNLNAYLDVNQYGVYDSLGNIIPNGQHYRFYEISGSAFAGVDIDYEIMNATPLYSVFDYKTTDSNIYGIVAAARNSTTAVTAASFSSKNLKPSYPRFYPISENSNNKFWSSARKIKSSDTQTTNSGIAASDGTISNADVFVQYNSSAKINKIKIRTQYYLGFPSRFRVYTTTSTASNILTGDWTQVYAYTGADASSPLSDGDLELYWDGSSWIIPDEYTKYTTDFSLSGAQSQTITGIRFRIEKLYSNNNTIAGVDAQVLEISPRIICDISPYTKSFDINSSISESALGLPVGGLISSNGTISLSNTDKYFCLNRNTSLVDKYLYPNVKFSISSIVNKNSQDIRVPIKTVYANSWEEDDESFEVTVQVEDYLKFFKSIASPDLLIANKRGVPSSIAILNLLDNIGYGKYQFVETSSAATNEDPNMQFFFSRKENTLAQTLEEIAVSCQLAMFMDAKNNFIVMSKERMSTGISSNSASWWFVGDPQNAINGTDPEYSYIYSGSYISNILSFSKTLEYPITDMRIEYTGLGLQKSPQFLTAFAEADNLDSVTKGDISILSSSNTNYVLDAVWRASDNNEENTIFSAFLQNDISASVPSSIQNLSSNPYKIDAENENDAIRRFYNSLIADDKRKIQIVFDNLSMESIAKNKSYSGYFIIDNETIRYKGILYNITSKNGQTTESILFSDAERVDIESSGVISISPRALILYLDFDIDNESASSVFTSNTLKKYILRSHGRAAKTYKNSGPSTEHLAATPNGYNKRWSKIKTIKLFDKDNKSLNTDIVAELKGRTETNKKISVPGNLALTGISPTAISAGATEINAGTISNFPVLYNVEKFISGFGISSSIGYNIISTRFKLISETPRDKYISGNAGIFFGLKNDGGQATGYFAELITFSGNAGKRLQDADFENLFLYKLTASADGQIIPQILGKKVVTAARVPETSYFNQNNTESKALVSDLKVLISSDKIKVYWEDQLAISYDRKDADKNIFSGTTKSGLFLRGNTRALFDYFLASSENEDTILSEYGMYANQEGDAPAYTDLYTAAKNKTITAQSLTQNTALNSKSKSTFYDDFGKTCREIKKFSARFDAPVLKAQILDYGSNFGRYRIYGFQPTSFGADFWLMNCCADVLKLGEDSSIPVMISGYQVKKSTDENLAVSLSDIINYNENEFNIDSSTSKMLPIFLNIQKNKEKYGENSLSLQAEFISSQKEALSLANWIMKNKSSEKMSISLDVFPNPLLEIGDRVKLFYKDKGLCQTIYGEKSFIISSIRYGVQNAGPTMSVELRELSNG